MIGAGDNFDFFFNDTATTEIYTLSLHDALPIYNCIHLFATYGSLKILTGNDLLSTTKINSGISAINYNP